MTATRLTAKGLATRGRIVEAASALMLERGVARTTIEDIQAAAHVSASQLYHYFADKQSLVTAVIELQTDRVLGVQHEGLDRITSIDDLPAWRDLMVETLRRYHCVGGCPIGSLASDLSETDPLARAQLAAAFSRWEGLIRDGLATIVAAGELGPDVDADRLALATLAAVQGGLLLSQIRRDTAPLEAAVDTMIEHLRGLRPGLRPGRRRPVHR